jgi:hypothetical protein
MSIHKIALLSNLLSSKNKNWGKVVTMLISIARINLEIEGSYTLDLEILDPKSA